MSSYLGALAGSLCVAGAKKAYGYGVDVVSGHASMRTLEGIKNGVEQMGGELAGSFGKRVGNFLGRAVAGHAIPLVKEESAAMATAARTFGHQAIDMYANRAKAEKPKVVEMTNSVSSQGDDVENITDRLSTVYKVASVAVAVGGSVAIAAGALPGAPIGLAYAGMQYGPKILNAMMTTNKADRKDVGFVDDVVLPAMERVAIESAGYVVGGIAKYETVQTAYAATVKAGEVAARRLTYFMPEAFQNAAGWLGSCIGTMDAGRVAMSDTVVAQANANGEFAQAGVELGLRSISVIAKENTAKNGFLDTAKKAAIIGMGLAGGATLIAAAPEMAVVVGGVAALSVAERTIRWMRAEEKAPAEDIEIEVEQKDLDESDFIMVDNQGDLEEVLEPTKDLAEAQGD